MSKQKLPDYLNRLIAYNQKERRKIIGLHSGTSADGVSTALAEISGSKLDTEVNLLAYENYDYPKKIRQKLLELFSRDKSTVEKLCQADVVLGDIFADAAYAISEKAGIDMADVDAIGSSGQYLYHVRLGQRPEDVWIGDKEIPSCIDLASGITIAERTGVTTVSNLRNRDYAVKGQGNPLVTYGDWVLFCHPEISRAVQNIGGIANPTVIPAGATVDEVFAFDTGPGNMVIDAVMRQISGGKRSYDKDGEIAAKGRVNEKLLNLLMEHPYIIKKPPKTTGREVFGEVFLNHVLKEAERVGLSDEDLLATVTALTAESIAHNYRSFVMPRVQVDEIVLSGGGAYNRTLVGMLKDRLPNTKFTDIEASIGIPILAREVVAVTIITNETLQGNPGNVPSATAAEKAVILGQITPGK